jgi:hypothetical protein
MSQNHLEAISTTDLAACTGGEACRWINKGAKNPDPHQWAVRGRREQQLGGNIGQGYHTTRQGCRTFIQDL